MNMSNSVTDGHIHGDGLNPLTTTPGVPLPVNVGNYPIGTKGSKLLMTPYHAPPSCPSGNISVSSQKVRFLVFNGYVFFLDINLALF
jgi:hypothetical protein